MALSLRPTDRILVLGASGWFGTAFRELVPSHVPLMSIASRSRGPFETWSQERVHSFGPSVVVNFAFLTRERVGVDGLENFIEVNENLTRQLLIAAQLPRVRAVLTVSSGAARALPLDLDVDPYGFLKRREEERLMALASPTRNVVVARAWSVSGHHVRRPHDYAFSGFILQAAQGVISIRATQPVFRRYVAASDFIEVCCKRMLSGWTGEIDSGGELIEMGSLARRIASIVNPNARIERPDLTSSEPSIYASDDVTWREACEHAGFVAAQIDSQVRKTARGLLGGSSSGEIPGTNIVRNQRS